ITRVVARVPFPVTHAAAYIVHEGYSISPVCLEPLTRFSGLRALRCDPVLGYDLGDNDIERLAVAWPCLVELALAAEYGWMVPSRITLAGVATLIRHCPNLSTLDLVLDGTGLHSVYIPPWEVIPNTTITVINIGNSFIDGDEACMARSLSLLMPRLAEIYSW
ncbi:hypothetical protein PLICRDRAFT_80197, partial [Plicaturopsis crispa FD-325 SS-3]